MHCTDQSLFINVSSPTNFCRLVYIYMTNAATGHGHLPSPWIWHILASPVWQCWDAHQPHKQNNIVAFLCALVILIPRKERAHIVFEWLKVKACCRGEYLTYCNLSQLLQVNMLLSVLATHLDMHNGWSSNFMEVAHQIQMPLTMQHRMEYQAYSAFRLMHSWGGRGRDRCGSDGSVWNMSEAG